MNIRCRFTGLCAFVRNTNGSSARVVLPEDSGSHPCDRHEVVLLMPISHWDPRVNTRVPSDQFFDQDYMEPVLVFSLSREDLSFPRGMVPFGTQPPDTVTNCPGMNSDGFGWVAKIRDLASNGAMQDAVLTNPSPADVVARIKLTSGHLSTLSFRAIGTVVGGSRILKWRFVTSGGGVVGTPRAIAEEVRLRDAITSPSGLYEITALGFAGASRPSIVLRENRGEVRFKIVNLPLDKLKNPMSSNPLQRDDCFSEFYKLGHVGGAIPEPVGIGDTCEHGGGGLSNPKCPCACFDDNPNA